MNLESELAGNVGSETPYLFFMGHDGNQHRNALFVQSGGTLQAIKETLKAL